MRISKDFYYFSFKREYYENIFNNLRRTGLAMPESMG